jgi:hypothetical protein
MKLRTFATPLIIGAFTLSAITGVLMFFESAVGLNKPAHEWLGLATVLGAALHVTTNWAAFKLYFKTSRPASLAIIGAFWLVLIGSFIAPGGGKQRGPNPQRLALDALSRVPLSAVAPLAHRSPEEVVASLTAAGFTVTGADDTLEHLAGKEREAQGRAFGAIFTLK